MTDISSLSPEDRKRFYAELRQNEEYKKNRKSLLSTTAMAAAALLFIALMVINDVMSMWLTLVDIILVVAFYMYFAFRAVRRQSEITERFGYSWSRKPKSKTKEKKDTAKGR